MEGAAPFYADPEFWVLVAFVIAIAYLVYKASPVLTRSLDDRAAKIKAELEEAQRLREEAQRTLAEYQRKQRDALKEAEEIIAHARAEAERAAQQAARDLETALERRQRLALDKIALEEAKATAEVRNTAVDLAVAAVGRMLAEDLDPARRNALIDQAIAALPQRLH
jgi:F-type H+-transporting ATPase subunit b